MDTKSMLMWLKEIFLKLNARIIQNEERDHSQQKCK